MAGALQYSFSTCLDVPRTENVGQPTTYRFNIGPALQPLMFQCRPIVYDAGPLIHH